MLGSLFLSPLRGVNPKPYIRIPSIIPIHGTRNPHIIRIPVLTSIKFRGCPTENAGSTLGFKVQGSKFWVQGLVFRILRLRVVG